MFSKEELGEDERFAEIAAAFEGGEPSGLQLSRAQDVLDAIKKRDAEWHYVQGAVYYYKRWYLDCKKQLKKAVKLAPEKVKYRAALNNLADIANYMKENKLSSTGKFSDGCAESCCRGCGLC